MTSSAADLGAFDGQKYLNLETYRKDSTAVRTPVWFATASSEVAGVTLYVYTLSDSGKAKRIRRSGKVKNRPVQCPRNGDRWVA